MVLPRNLRTALDPTRRGTSRATSGWPSTCCTYACAAPEAAPPPGTRLPRTAAPILTHPARPTVNTPPPTR